MDYRSPLQPIEWKMSFQLDDKRVLITDKCILIDQRYVLIDPVPPDGTLTPYRRVNEYLALSANQKFSFTEMSTVENGHYEGLDGLVFNKKYVSFLLQRIPERMLSFGITGGRKDPVLVYRNEDLIGLLMPYLIAPKFGCELIDQAKAGDAFAQLSLGYHYLSGREVPQDYYEAAKWLRKAVDQDEPTAHFEMGMLYFFGAGVTMNWVDALVLFDRAIEMGVKNAIRWRHILLGMMPIEQSRLAGYGSAKELGSIPGHSDQAQTDW